MRETPHEEHHPHHYGDDNDNDDDKERASSQRQQQQPWTSDTRTANANGNGHGRPDDDPLLARLQQRLLVDEFTDALAEYVRARSCSAARDDGGADDVRRCAAVLRTVLAADATWRGVAIERADSAEGVLNRLVELSGFYRAPRIYFLPNALQFADDGTGRVTAEFYASATWPLPWRPRMVARGRLILTLTSGGDVGDGGDGGGADHADGESTPSWRARSSDEQTPPLPPPPHQQQQQRYRDDHRHRYRIRAVHEEHFWSYADLVRQLIPPLDDYAPVFPAPLPENERYLRGACTNAARSRTRRTLSNRFSVLHALRGAKEYRIVSEPPSRAYIECYAPVGTPEASQIQGGPGGAIPSLPGYAFNMSFFRRRVRIHPDEFTMVTPLSVQRYLPLDHDLDRVAPAPPPHASSREAARTATTDGDFEVADERELEERMRRQVRAWEVDGRVAVQWRFAVPLRDASGRRVRVAPHPCADAFGRGERRVPGDEAAAAAADESEHHLDRARDHDHQASAVRHDDNDVAGWAPVVGARATAAEDVIQVTLSSPPPSLPSKPSASSSSSPTTTTTTTPDNNDRTASAPVRANHDADADAAPAIPPPAYPLPLVRYVLSPETARVLAVRPFNGDATKRRILDERLALLRALRRDGVVPRDWMPRESRWSVAQYDTSIGFNRDGEVALAVYKATWAPLRSNEIVLELPVEAAAAVG